MTATLPTLSVIIVNWNGRHFLSRCFESLRAQTLKSVRVIFVDNGSTDDSVAWTQDNFPEVHILELGENLGYAEGNNRGAQAAHGDYILFLNNDTHLDPRALELLVVAAERSAAAQILAPQLRSYDGSHDITVGIGVDIFGFPCAGKVFYADGAALFIRRAIFLELGGFDPGYFMFFEETDLCWRAWLYGYRVESVPQAVIYHQVGGTAGPASVSGDRYVTSRRKRRLTHRNQIATLLKNYSTPSLVALLPVFAVLTLGEMTLLCANGQRGAVVEAYIPAWRDLWRGRAHLQTQRARVQSMRTVSDWAIIRHMQWKIAMVEHLVHVGVPKIR